MCVGDIVEPSLMNIMLNGERIEVVNSFKYLGSCFRSNGGVKEDVSIRVGEGRKTFGAMKRMWSGKSVTKGEKRVI